MNWLLAFAEPQRITAWTLRDWDRVVRLGRRLRLLARLEATITRAHLGDAVPAPARKHLVAARRLSADRVRALRWLMERLPLMLDASCRPLVLLKGAAYVAQQLPIAEGRLPSDLDILVPRARLDALQRRLLETGWTEPDLDEHDRRYYLEWSHELPPMVHPSFAVELDVHHNVLPPRDGRSPDAEFLLEALVPTSMAPWQALGPADQVLHSAAHLFFDSEPVDRLRDLVDIDGLLRHFGADPDFWRTMPSRAQKMGALEPLCLACEFATEWLGTPIDERWLREVRREAGWGWRQQAWSGLFRHSLQPSEPDERDSLAKRFAATALLARYHAHRMPMTTLVPHLWHKWRLRAKTAAVEPDQLLDPAADRSTAP